MSRVNEMFDKLKTIVPEGRNKHEEDNKETKVRRQIDRQIDRQKDRQIDRLTEMQRYTNRY